jgi:hypothetical protein
MTVKIYNIFFKIKNIFKAFFKERYLKKKYKSFVTDQKLNYDFSKSPNRLVFINVAIAKIYSKKKSCNYLEIGCDENKVFNYVAVPDSFKIGVDPVQGGNIKSTSDNFFKNNLGKFDVIFIDGLHEYEQTQRDIINSLEFLNVGGLILIHDMLPLDWKSEFVPRIQKNWLGDVWKCGYELSQSINLEFKIIKADNGIGIIKKLSEEYTYKKDLEIKDKRFLHFLKIHKKLPIIEDFEGIKYILSS